MAPRLHFLHVFPNFGPGGMELRVIRIINGMRFDARHTILALLGNFEAKRFLNPGIPVDFLEPPLRTGAFSYVHALWKILRAQNPDLLLTYNWGSIDAVLSAWGTRRPAHVHHECGFGAEEANRLKPARVLARRILLRRAFGVAVTSKTLREVSINQFKISPDKVRWIRTGVDLQRFRPGLSRDWRRQIGVGESELLFGFVGVLRAEKDLPLLLRAFACANIPNARLVIVGDGAERQRLEQKAQEEGLAGRVIFPGRVPDPALCLAALDVFVLSSCTEQTSNALLEAMACGLPAISTDAGDSPEILDHAGPPVIVPSRDLQGYIKALQQVAASPEFRRELGEANRRRCVERYPLEAMVREYEALYLAACTRRGTAR